MKEKIIAFTFVLILFFFFSLGIIKKEQSISLMERRKLMTKETLKEDFLGNLENYFEDQFPFRNTFLSLYSFVDRIFFKNIENNDLYITNDYLIEKNYPLNEKSLEGFIKKINWIKENYLEKNNVYYAIIPDKSYFLKDSKYLKIDFLTVLEQIKKEIKASYIDLFTIFNLEDYYHTDIHLKQESYKKVIEIFSQIFSYPNIEKTDTIQTYSDFLGASFKKGSFFAKKESLNYLTNEWTKNAKVWHLEYGNQPVYDLEKLGGMDSYSVFLSGPSALIEITNPFATTNKELVLFRDSFGSSLSPLLIPYYEKITLVDLRYMNMEQVAKHISFENQDVLFLYSSLIVNESNLLKVKIS